MDAYIAGNRWFYMIGGVGGAPEGTASLYPDLHYGITGLISLPWPKGLVATLGASQIHGEDESYARVLSSGAMYYLGRSIWSGSISFNRSYPGAVPSKSGNLNVQYGTQDKFWIGAGVGGGRIAYQTVGLEPLNVRFQTYGPSFFYQQWVNTHWGFIVKYDYQNQIDAFQRHGLAANLFFELP
jgi:YaiO family outer membrane protein